LKAVANGDAALRKLQFNHSDLAQSLTRSVDVAALRTIGHAA